MASTRDRKTRDRKALRHAARLLAAEAQVCWDSNVNRVKSHPNFGKIDDVTEAALHEDLVGSVKKLMAIARRLR